MNKYFPIAMAAALIVFSLAVDALAADPFEGTWVLKLAESQFNSSPAPQSRIVKIEAQKNSQSLVVDEVDAEGKILHGGFFAKYNEMDYPYTLRPAEDTIALKRSNMNTIVSTSKKNGETVSVIRWIVSKDGKTLIGTEKGKNAEGKPVMSIYVYGRQDNPELSKSVDNGRR